MTEIKPDNQQTIEFLRAFHPNGPWILTRIDVNKKGIKTEAFGPSSEKQLITFLNRWNGVQNLYFAVNPTRVLNKKSSKKDVVQINYLHCDIDADATDNLEEAKAELLSRLTDKLPEGVPEPSWVVDSGGGYWTFHKLAKPIKTGTEMLGTDPGVNKEIEDRIEDLERYNIGLEEQLSADNCHNIDRIARLPGSVNLPDSKKIAKGRQRALARVVSYNKDAVYTLNDFEKGTPKLGSNSANGEANNGSNRLIKPVNVNQLDGIDLKDLPPEVAEWCPIVIAQGSHPDDEKYQYNSRSEALFAVVCELVRAGCTNTVIARVITDQRYLISESVNERKDKQRYVNRQIQRARDFCDEPWLPGWNDRYAIIQNCRPAARVMEILSDHELGGTEVTYKSFADVRNAHLHETMVVKIDDKAKTLQLADVWLRHKRARRYKQVAFYPNRELPSDVLNLWQGFSVVPGTGDCSLILKHIRDNICSGDEEAYNYMLGWLARLVQYPDKMGEVAVILRSGKGTGKSFFANIIGAMFGEHYTTISNSDHLTGRFNAHLQRCVLLFADEAFFAGDKKGEGTLKSIVTDSRIFVEPKGVDGSMRRNFLHIIMASNKQWVVPASHDERRFFVLDVANDQKQNTEYFNALAKQVDNGGLEALLDYLLKYDISEFNVRKVPQNKALQEQKNMSLGSVERWWLQRLSEGESTTGSCLWEVDVPSRLLYEDYLNFCRKGGDSYKEKQQAFGRFISTLHPNVKRANKTWEHYVWLDDGTKIKKPGRGMVYTLPDLMTCRIEWDERFGNHEWLEMAEDQGFLQTDGEGIPF